MLEVNVSSNSLQLLGRDGLHGDSYNAICSIPEADVTGIRAALRGPPRHSQNKDLDKDPENDRNMPRFELRIPDARAGATSTKDIYTDGQSKVEYGCGICR